MSGLGRRVVVVEDEPLVSSLLVERLLAAGFEVEAAASALDGRQLVERFDPDVALLDLTLGRGPSGADLAHILHQEAPHVALLILTKHPDTRTAGIGVAGLPPSCGFLRKSMVTDGDALIAAIELVLAGHPSGVQADRDPGRPLATLTQTQVEVLRMVAQGYTNPEIARRRSVSVGSVEQMLNTIYRGLGLEASGAISSRVEAVRIFISHAGVPERG